mgnify:CR=1 FL=1
MTAPVTQQKGEAIAMTVPVTQQAKGGDWLVRFTMPASFTLATLPKPTDARIRLVAVPGRKVASLRSTWPAGANLKRASSPASAGSLSICTSRTPYSVPGPTLQLRPRTLRHGLQNRTRHSQLSLNRYSSARHFEPVTPTLQAKP